MLQINFLQSINEKTLRHKIAFLQFKHPPHFKQGFALRKSYAALIGN